MSIILGIDPGSRVTGFGAIKVHKLNRPNLTSIEVVSFGVIQLNEKASFPIRMRELGESLHQVFLKLKPDGVAIEKIFLGKSADSAFKLGHARGVAMYEAALHDAEIFEYATRVVKKSITGRGGADKAEVQMMVQRLLGIDKIKRLDASDALALAIHHSYQIQTLGLRVRKNDEVNL